MREPTEKEEFPPEPEPIFEKSAAIDHLRQAFLSIAKDLFDEGKNQYTASFEEVRTFADRRKIEFRAVPRRLWAFLTQPVWILNRMKQPKEYSRMTLFLLDVVRFGGTFATLFLILFSALNYQSFWQIASAKLDPLQKIDEQNALATVDTDLKQKLLKSPFLPTAGAQEGDLLSFLPAVGPPENRLIIPKLGLNVPIVSPSLDNLLKEDWKGVETDIQRALQEGVVHYPGTAKPGQGGNFFITGHSSYYPWSPGSYKTVFARLHELEKGDEYWVYFGGDRHRYVIEDKKEVKPSDVSVLDQPVEKRLSTLMTCTPVGTTLRRLIISAQEVDPLTGTPMSIGEQPERAKATRIRPSALPI